MKNILLILAAVLLTPMAHAKMVSQLEVAVDGQPLTFLISPYESIQIQGLPYLGIHLYSIQSDTLYIQHPDEPNWLALPLGNIADVVPTAHLEKGNQSGEFLGTPNRHWAIRIGARICDHVLTNVDAGKRTGADISHFARISAGLAYIYGNQLGQDSCAAYLIPPVIGRMMGLPIHANGSGGSYDVKKLNTLPPEISKALPQPETYELFSAKSHIRFLERQLSPTARTTFEKSSTRLPEQQRLRALKHLLSQN